MNILIIEDEDKTRRYIQKGLTENSYSVSAFDNAEDGLHAAFETNYDVIILDVMLPTLNGWEVIKKIRQHNPHVPVLFLTARDSIEDRVKGLELGADDYLIKPFAFSELLARVRVLGRRTSVSQEELINTADLKIDFLRHKVSRGGKNLALTQKEFVLLSLLARHQGEVLSRTLIAERVWDMNFDSNTNVVDVAIRRLRNKIDDDFDLKLIHSVRGVGYVFEIR